MSRTQLRLPRHLRLLAIYKCPSIPGCVSQGKTEQEAVENIKDAIKQSLEVRSEKGIPLTVSLREVEVLV